MPVFVPKRVSVPDSKTVRPIGRLAIVAAIAFGVAAPAAFGADAREFESGDDHGHGVEIGDDHGVHPEFGDDHGGLVAPGPVWSAPAWPTTDDHGGWFHD